MPFAKCFLFRSLGFVGLIFPLCFCAYLFPQNNNSKKDTSPEAGSKFGVKVNAIIVKAIVTDKRGNPVTDLTARDFKLYDDGIPQDIQTLALESIGPPELEITQNTGASSVAKRVPELEVAQPSRRMPRMVSIVIDDLTMESPTGANRRPGSILDFPRMVDAIKRFIKTDLNPEDQTCILSGSRNVQFPFTDDKTLLLEELDTVTRKLNTNTAFRDSESEISDTQAWMVANDLVPDSMARDWKRWLAIRQNADLQSRTRNLLYTIRQHLRVLSHFEGPKIVVLFSDGFIAEAGNQTGSVEAREVQALIDMALHSDVIMSAVSIRGISAEAIMSFPEIQQKKLSTTSIHSKQQAPAQDRKDEEEAHRPASVPEEMDRVMQEKPMEQMASETGGDFFTSSNDIYANLKTIAQRRYTHYVLTYFMPVHRPNGEYHHIKLRVTRPGLQVSHRKGYYSPTEELTFENSNKEDIVAALRAPGNMNEIPITLSYSSSQEEDGTYAVSFITNVNVRKLRFPEENNRRRNQISLVLVAFDEMEHFINGLEKSIDFQLLETSYNNMHQHGLTSRVEFKLPIGRYKIKAVIRENSQGKMGSITKSVEIP